MSKKQRSKVMNNRDNKRLGNYRNLKCKGGEEESNLYLSF